MAVMFQIACALALDVPEVLHESWGHMNNQDVDCGCLSSDRTGAYVHGLTVASPLQDLVSAPGEPWDAASAGLSRVPEGRYPDAPSSCGTMHSVTMRAGPVPYMSHRAGAYSRLLLATYVRWQAGLLTASDWLQPVTRGRGGGGGLCAGLADVS